MQNNSHRRNTDVVENKRWKGQMVTDRFGLEYIFHLFYDQEDALTVYLYRDQREVGHIFCSFENDEMEIQDIIIHNNVVHGQRGCFFSLLRMFHWKPKQTNYRNRGLGTILLKYVVERARQRGIKRITGRVKPHDHEETPHLLEWYQINGFTILSGKAPKGIKPLYYISKDLS